MLIFDYHYRRSIIIIDYREIIRLKSEDYSNTNGGGGKGIRVVYNEEDLLRSLEQCIKEAERVFGFGSILVERYNEKAKHIEVQILADQYGNVIHLGDRECTIQRKNQKLIK